MRQMQDLLPALHECELAIIQYLARPNADVSQEPKVTSRMCSCQVAKREDVGGSIRSTDALYILTIAKSAGEHAVGTAIPG